MFDPRPHTRQALAHGSPYERVVNPEVGVNQPVPHAGHLAPWKVHIVLSDTFGQGLDRFADDLELADDGARGLVVGDELILAHLPKVWELTGQSMGG